MATLTVGANGTFTRIADAVAAARDGDVVEVQAGTYVNDFTRIAAKITLRGVGGMVNLVATVAPRDGKAIMTVATDLVLENFSFTGAKVYDANGAGIRYEGGALVVRDCLFYDNENGILGASDPNGTILIERSEFSHNGNGNGLSHNLYVNNIKQLTIRDSYFHDAVVGHEIKSRAQNTTITGSRIMDGSGNASYSVDLPNGGVALLQNNVIQKGANAENRAILHFGGESEPYPGSRLSLIGNTIVNDRAAVTGLNNAAGAPLTVTGNILFGVTPDAFGGTDADNVVLASRPTLDVASHMPVPPAPIPPAVPPTLFTPVPDSVGYVTFGREGAVRANGHVLRVGNGQAYTSLQQALVASQDGDTVQVDAGTYTDDFAVANRRVIIEGVGGIARFVAVGGPENGKGSLVAKVDLTVRNLEFTGNWNYDGNGAGIRQDGGHLTVVNSYFHDNHVSILATAGFSGSVSVYDSEIGHNGNEAKGGHNINVGAVGSFTLENSYVWGAFSGHEVNSHALFTRITGSRIIDGADVGTSFSVNLGHGGDAVIQDTLIVKGAQAANGVLVHVGGEGPAYANSDIRIIDSTLVSQMENYWHPYTYFVVGDPNGSGVAPAIAVTGVTFVGGVAGSEQVVQAVNNDARVAASAVIDTSAPWSAAASAAASMAPVGPNTLMLRLSQARQFGDAQFVVRVDGDAVGGGTVTASGTDPYQQFTYTGLWGSGAHDIEIEAINVRYGISLAARLLDVGSVNLDGAEAHGHGAAANWGLGDMNQWRPKFTVTLQGRDLAPPLVPEPAPAPIPNHRLSSYPDQGTPPRWPCASQTPAHAGPG